MSEVKVVLAQPRGFCAGVRRAIGIVERALEGVSSVGISAGASAPEILVDGLVARLAGLGFDRVELQRGTAEDVVFSMPARLADPATGRVPRTPLAGEVSPAPGGVR